MRSADILHDVYAEAERIVGVRQSVEADTCEATQLDGRIKRRQAIDHVVVDVLTAVQASAGNRAEIEIGTAVSAPDQIDIKIGRSREEAEPAYPTAREGRGNDRIVVGPF